MLALYLFVVKINLCKRFKKYLGRKLSYVNIKLKCSIFRTKQSFNKSILEFKQIKPVAINQLIKRGVDKFQRWIQTIRKVRNQQMQLDLIEKLIQEIARRGRKIIGVKTDLKWIRKILVIQMTMCQYILRSSKTIMKCLPEEYNNYFILQKMQMNLIILQANAKLI